MDSLHLRRRREEFRLEYIGVLKKLIADGERWLNQAAAWGVKPAGLDELKHEIAECRKELAWLTRRSPAS
jgi:hypothetical protein